MDYLEYLQQQLRQHTAVIVTTIKIVLIIFMSLTVAKTILSYIKINSASNLLNNSTPAANTAIKRPSFKTSSLELFGSINTARSVSRKIDTPETKLNLEIQGIFIAKDPTLSKAIVAEKNKLGQLFSIGETLPGNATLDSIFDNHILIRRNNKVEKLLFSDQKFQFIGSKTSQDFPTQLKKEATSKGPKFSKPIGAVVNNSEEKSRNGRVINQYKEKLRKDLEGTLRQSGITPLAVGESGGYKIGPDATSFVTQTGLQSGDVILSVNGNPVGKTENDTKIMAQIVSSSRARIEVQRGTRRFFLTVPIPK